MGPRTSCSHGLFAPTAKRKDIIESSAVHSRDKQRNSMLPRPLAFLKDWPPRALLTGLGRRSILNCTGCSPEPRRASKHGDTASLSELVSFLASTTHQMRQVPCVRSQSTSKDCARRLWNPSPKVG